MAGVMGVIPWQSPMNLGLVVPGAQLFVYNDGTTTKRAIYTTSALSVQHTNPLVADAYGRLAAWWVDPTGGPYKLVLAPADDTDPPVSAFKTEDIIPIGVDDSSLSDNVPLKDEENTFTENITISNDNPALIINETDSNNAAFVQFNDNATPKGYVGQSYNTGSLINGSASGDMGVRALSGRVLFSYDDGITIGAMFGETETEINSTTFDLNTTDTTIDASQDIIVTAGSELVLTASGATINLGPSGTNLTDDVVKFSGISTTGSAANAFLDSGNGNSLLRSTSSIAYKKDIESLTDYTRFLKLRPITYRSKAPADDPNREFIGLIAEQVAEVDPRLVHFMDGKPDGVMYDRVTVGLLGIAQEQQEQIDELRRQIETLKH